jgi:hypothetical protein
MIENTFCLLPGIGAKTERRLWDAGVLTWDDLLSTAGSPVPPLARALAPDRLAEARARLEQRDADYFAGLLPAAEQWRLYGDFGDSVAYFDIETTGLSVDEDHITCIALYDGARVRTYVYGDNLEEFADDIRDYSLMVTFNGKSFDVPVIERQLKIRLPKAHVDLRWVLRALGFRGGLKKCERQIGISRDELEGVDGYLAVLLWHEYRASGDKRALETLLAYNVADVLGLEHLLALAYNRKLEGTPFALERAIALPTPVDNPHRPDAGILARVRGSYTG